MAHIARSRRTNTVALVAFALGALALTACSGGEAKDAAASAGTSSSPSPSATRQGADTPATADPSDGGGETGTSSGSGGSSPSSDPGAEDDQDGGVGMCETTDLSYNVTVASSPVNHALLTAVNKGAEPCLLPAGDLVITIPGLDGAAEHTGPDGTDWILKTGESAYAGIMFSRADTAGGSSTDKVEVALSAAESPSTVGIDGGPVTVNDAQVTAFFGSAEDALTY
jgi:hypothetical protein